jgi:Tfp pilus assembly protein PilZ
LLLAVDCRNPNGAAETGGDLAMAASSGEKEDSKEQEKLAPCKVSFSVGDKIHQGSSVHFSELGIFVQCRQPASLNLKLKLLLEFPNLDNPIEVWGEVVWTNMYGPDDAITPRGMGVKFLQEDTDILRTLGEMALLYDNLDKPYQCYYS